MNEPRLSQTHRRASGLRSEALDGARAHRHDADTRSRWQALLPCVGPLALFLVWDLVVRLGLIKAILLPPPLATIQALVTGCSAARSHRLRRHGLAHRAGVPPCAAAVGMPLGIRPRQQREGLSVGRVPGRLLRSTPSSALIPLFLLIFGVSDINKVAIAAFGALLIVVFNSAYGVINARKQRVMAARVMGASRWQDLQGRADLGEPAADASSGCARRCRWRWSSSSSPRCSSAPTAASATASSTRSRC
jgi:NitT/TauT family transport system permease protein